jgi:serine/threonine protein kinase
MVPPRFRSVQHYYVGRARATGSYCTVYEAYRKEDYGTVAIRLVSKRRLADSPIHDSILFNETVLVRLLSHPHICEIVEVFESAAQIFQVMKWYDEGDLLSYISARKPAPLALLAIFDEVLSAVDYLHSLHIAHLDLKPENVLVTDSGHARLTDFSFATFSFAPARSCLLGSIGYFGPELLTGAHFDPEKADVFSLGIFLYFLMKGGLPVEDPRKLHIARLDFTGVDADVVALISSMLSPTPASRPSVAAIRQHRAFSGLSNRPVSLQAPDLGRPLSGINERLLSRLADALVTDTALLKGALYSGAMNREKVLYALAAASPTFMGADDAGDFGIGAHTPSSSLPEGTALSRDCAVFPEGEFTQAIAESRAAIVSAIVKFMLAQRFVVAGTADGAREFVLNRPDEDVCVDMDVWDAGDGQSCLKVREKKPSGALEEVREFVARRFGLRQA